MWFASLLSSLGGAGSAGAAGSAGTGAGLWGMGSQAAGSGGAPNLGILGSGFGMGPGSPAREWKAPNQPLTPYGVATKSPPVQMGAPRDSGGGPSWLADWLRQYQFR